MRIKSLGIGLLAAALGWLGPAWVCAQGLTATAVTTAHAATLETAPGQVRPLAVGRLITAGTLTIADGAQVMLFDGGGVVLVARGPAVLVMAEDPGSGGSVLALQNGCLAVTATDPAAAGAPLALRVLLASEAASARLNVVAGRTYLQRAMDGTAAIGFDGAAGTSLPVAVAGRDEQVATGAVLRLAADGTGSPQPLEPWLTSSCLAGVWSRDLGLSSARDSRVEVETALLRDIIYWDRRAGASYIVPRLQEYRYAAEIRQVVQTVTVSSSTAAAAGAVQTQPFNAANEVPLLSPAAASVQNIGGIGAGITAIGLNNSAALLLRQTGSRGLGFRGLEQLAIPGLSPGGRTIGPAGLGAK